MSEKKEHVNLQEELEAARETIGALRRRLARIENGEKETPFLHQLKAYQQRIEEEAIKLKESQDWSRLLVENAIDAIVGMDSDGMMETLRTGIQEQNPCLDGKRQRLSGAVWLM